MLPREYVVVRTVGRWVLASTIVLLPIDVHDVTLVAFGYWLAGLGLWGVLAEPPQGPSVARQVVSESVS